MYRFLMTAAVFATGGCAVNQSAELPTLANAQRTTEGAPQDASDQQFASSAIADVRTVDISDLEANVVCEQLKRPGSRMAERVCYTEEAYAARTELESERAQEYADALQRDQFNREMREQMEEDRRRQSSGVAR